ncbi:MAG: hypothetical protein NC191_04715 [Muribaculaceae bacterium]|nr:hypothetical protein [Muribaculaceae bacterium]
MFNYSPYTYNNLFVDNIKEAEASAIDFSGNPVFYLNKKENEVYVKQFNTQTGKIFFGKYVFTPITPEEPKEDVMTMLKKLDDKYNYLYERFEETLTPTPSPRGRGEKDAERKEKVKNDE